MEITDIIQTPTIEISRLVTGYTVRGCQREVCRPFDAALYPGQLTCLIGPNGSGKSTLLRTLAAFQPALAGEIKINGKPLAGYSRAELARIISVVLTERPSSANMTVRDLIALGRSPYSDFWGRVTNEDNAIINNALNLVGIEELASRRLSTLSDGERQKALIAKSLAQQTPIIFLDEPTAFLDYPSKFELLILLHRLAYEEGKTIFLSTHDLDIALRLADMLWMLDKRFGITIGSPETLSLNGSIARYFERDGLKYDPKNRIFII